MSQHTYCGKSILDGCTVSAYIDTIGQTTDNKNIGALGCKVAYETFAEITSIVGALASSYNTYNAARIE
jgi:hypothetical protein